MPDSTPIQSIVPLDLSRFTRPIVSGNRSWIWRAAWYLLSGLVFQSIFVSLLPNGLKATLLRAFGAKVGRGFVCKPRVSIKYPWFLSMGDHVWIGEGVWIDNLCPVTIGSHACISQGVKIVTGSHDWSDPTFPFFARPVIIGDGVWVTAFRVIRPGVTVPPHVAVIDDLTARAVRAASAPAEPPSS